MQVHTNPRRQSINDITLVRGWGTKTCPKMGTRVEFEKWLFEKGLQTSVGWLPWN